MDHRDIELVELRKRVQTLESELRVLHPWLIELQEDSEHLWRELQNLRRPSERPTRPPPAQQNVLGVRGKLPPKG